MDLTALGIVIGLAACSGYAVTKHSRQRGIDIATTVLCFLSGFSVPAGAALIAAGLRGDASKLPSSWREYVAVAGIVAIGLAAQYLMHVFRAAWTPPATLDTAGSRPAAEQRANEASAPGASEDPTSGHERQGAAERK